MKRKRIAAVAWLLFGRRRRAIASVWRVTPAPMVTRRRRLGLRDAGTFSVVVAFRSRADLLRAIRFSRCRSVRAFAVRFGARRIWPFRAYVCRMWPELYRRKRAPRKSCWSVVFQIVADVGIFGR